MGVAVSTIAYPVTLVKQDGPHQLWTRYVMSVPVGQTVTEGVWAGPVDFPGEGGHGQVLLHVSGAPSVANGTVFTVYGAFSEPSTTPTDRNWFLARGDRASGAGGVNDTLNAVTCGGMITIVTPARSYLLRISGVSGAASSPVNITVLTIKSNG